MRARRHCLAAAAATAVLAVSGTACSSSDTAPADAAAPSTTTSASASSASNPPGPEPTGPGPDLLPGMPPPLSPTDVYAADHTLSPAVAGAKALVYVPNTKDNTVTVIDQASMAVIGRFPVGPEPQHVVPSYDLTALYVASDLVSAGGSLTPIDPTTGTPGAPIPVADPYNLYFTPDGHSAIVVAEELKRLDFYDPNTWTLQQSVPVPQCAGVDHMDFTADGTTLLASCEFADAMMVMDVASKAVLRTIALPQRRDGMPQDVKLSPDGRTFYVADMKADGVYLIDGHANGVIGFQPTGKGTHGLYVSRDSKRLFVTNRNEGSISVLDAATGTPIAKWKFPAEAVPTWATSPPTALYSGSPGATTTSSTRSAPPTGTSSRRSRSARARTGCASGPNPGDTHWDTPAFCADRAPAQRPNVRGSAADV